MTIKCEIEQVQFEQLRLLVNVLSVFHFRIIVKA